MPSSALHVDLRILEGLEHELWGKQNSSVGSAVDHPTGSSFSSTASGAGGGGAPPLPPVPPMNAPAMGQPMSPMPPMMQQPPVPVPVPVPVSVPVPGPPVAGMNMNPPGTPIEGGGVMPMAGQGPGSAVRTPTMAAMPISDAVHAAAVAGVLPPMQQHPPIA